MVTPLIQGRWVIMVCGRERVGGRGWEEERRKREGREEDGRREGREEERREGGEREGRREGKEERVLVTISHAARDQSVASYLNCGINSCPYLWKHMKNG